MLFKNICDFQRILRFLKSCVWFLESVYDVMNTWEYTVFLSLSLNTANTRLRCWGDLSGIASHKNSYFSVQEGFVAHACDVSNAWLSKRLTHRGSDYWRCLFSMPVTKCKNYKNILCDGWDSQGKNQTYMKCYSELKNISSAVNPLQWESLNLKKLK